MADPIKYTLGYDFSTLPLTNAAPHFNDELVDVSFSIGQIVDALKQVRRSDGKLQNGIVTSDSFAPGVSAVFTQTLLASTAAVTAAANAKVYADVSLVAANTAITGGTQNDYGTAAGFAAVTVPLGVQTAHLSGGTTLGDRKGGNIRRVASEPVVGRKVRSADRYLPNGTVSASNGGWWRYYEDADRPPILLLVEGQSNATIYRPYTWPVAPPVNLALWDWTGLEHTDGLGTGTGFYPLTGTVIGFAHALGAEIARDNPGRMVYIVNIGVGGVRIAQWLVGASAPDMYAATKRNIEAALALIGEPVELIHAWWQGESDSGFDGNPQNPNYPANFITHRNRKRGETWYPANTPMVVMAMPSYAATVPQYNSKILQGMAADAGRTVFADTSNLPADCWEATENNIHATAKGYEIAGKIAFQALAKGTGRAGGNGFSDPAFRTWDMPTQPSGARGAPGAITGPSAVFPLSVINHDVSTPFGSNLNDGGAYILKPGMYLIIYNMEASGGALTAELQKNNVRIPGSRLFLPSGARASAMVVTPLVQGDSITVYVASGTAAAGTSFTLHYLG